MSNAAEVGLFEDDLIDVSSRANKDFQQHNSQPCFQQNSTSYLAHDFESCRKYEIRSPHFPEMPSGCHGNPPSIHIVDTESFNNEGEGTIVAGAKEVVGCCLTFVHCFC